MYGNNFAGGNSSCAFDDSAFRPDSEPGAVIRLKIRIHDKHGSAARQRNLSGRQDMSIRCHEFWPDHPGTVGGRIVAVIQEIPAGVLVRWTLSSTFFHAEKLVRDLERGFSASSVGIGCHGIIRERSSRTSAVILDTRRVRQSVRNAPFRPAGACGQAHAAGTSGASGSIGSAGSFCSAWRTPAWAMTTSAPSCSSVL